MKNRKISIKEIFEENYEEFWEQNETKFPEEEWKTFANKQVRTS